MKHKTFHLCLGLKRSYIPKHCGELPNTNKYRSCRWMSDMNPFTSISSQIPAISFWDDVLQSQIATNWNTFQTTQLSLTLRRFNMTRRCLCTSKNHRSNTLWSLFFDCLAPCFPCHWGMSWYLLKAVVQQYSIQVNYQVWPATPHSLETTQVPKPVCWKTYLQNESKNPIYMKSTSISF